MSGRGERIRVLYLMPGLGMGGTERVVCDCATHLDADAFTTSVGVLHDGDMREQFGARGISTHVLRNGIGSPLAAGRVLATRARLRAIARSIDVVHTHHLTMLFYAALAAVPRRSWKWVHTEHCVPTIPDYYPTWLLQLGRQLLRRPDALVGVASSVTAYYRSDVRGVSSHAFTIPNGIELDRFTPSSNCIANRARLDLPANAWIIGIIGRLRPQKNHAALIRALAKLLGSVPNASLVVVGDGDLEDSLRRLAADLHVLHRVAFLGSRHDIPEILACFDVYCLPSFFEGMPISLLEAMASELPIVASDVLGIREFVTNANSGLLVPSDDPERLCEALRTLHRDPELARRLARNGHEWVTRNGSVGLMIASHATLYRRLLGPPISGVDALRGCASGDLLG
jgi:glycosyltransferase involved in cell wall biosynthesis